MELSKLEQIIGYEFRDKQLLQRAVTHSSYANEKLGSPGEGNERLEFLGDAVLGACVGLQLYNRYTDKEEGYLTKMRASIVCERSLGNAGKKLGVNEFLLLSRGEESGGGRDRISIIADCMEAGAAGTAEPQSRGGRRSADPLRDRLGEWAGPRQDLYVRRIRLR